jgi:hypothetical protein
MVRCKLVASSIGAGLFLSGILLSPGCTGDEGQPPRESISAPRKGGGVIDAGAGEKTKAGKVGGKVGAKSGLD